MQQNVTAEKAWVSKDWSRVRIVKTVRCQCQPLTEGEKRARELVLLLEAPTLSTPRQKRLTALMESFSEEDLAAILAASSPSESGALKVPRAFRFGSATRSHLGTPYDEYYPPVGHTEPIERLVDAFDKSQN